MKFENVFMLNILNEYFLIFFLRPLTMFSFSELSDFRGLEIVHVFISIFKSVYRSFQTRF